MTRFYRGAGAAPSSLQSHRAGGTSFPQQNEVATTFADGLTIVTGQFKTVLTNAVTRESLALNIPGPGKYTTTDDGGLRIDVMGPWLVFWSAGQMGPGTPGGIVFMNGRAVVTVAPDGTFGFTQAAGTSADVCAALSG